MDSDLNENLPEIEPASEPVTPISEPKPKAKRGRKPAPRDENGNIIRETINVSAPVRKPAAKAANHEAIATQIIGLHQLIAQLPGCACMAMSAEEAKLLAPALANVSEQYNVSISPKASAAMQLIAVAFLVYQPRIVTIIKGVREKKRLKPLPDASVDSAPESHESAPAGAL